MTTNRERAREIVVFGIAGGMHRDDFAGIIAAALDAAEARATAAEREECALIARDYSSATTWNYAEREAYTIGTEIAAAIRSRSSQAAEITAAKCGGKAGA